MLDQISSFEGQIRCRNIFEQDGRRIKSIRTDGGGEYRKQMAELCRETGIHHEETAPYTPEQNGVAERANRTVCERIRAILADTGLPKELWAELARTVAHVKNRSPTRALKGMTPYEALYGQRPDVSHFVAIGTKAFVHMPKKKTKKLDPRNFEGIMVGYGGSHQYRIWIPGTNKIRVSRDVRFVGEARDMSVAVGAGGSGTGAGGSGMGVGGLEPAEKPEKVIYDMIEVLPPPRDEPVSESDLEDEGSSESQSESGESDSEDDTHESEVSPPRDESEPFVSAPSSPQQPADPPAHRVRKPKPPPYDPSSYVSAEHEKAQSQSQISYAFKTTTTWSESAEIEPQSYEEAVNHPVYGKEWRAAIQEEYDSLMKNGAWELTDLPLGKNLVTCKWVFKAKHDANGNVVRFKAWLVARGFSQALRHRLFRHFCTCRKAHHLPRHFRTCCARTVGDSWDGCDHSVFTWIIG